MEENKENNLLANANIQILTNITNDKSVKADIINEVKEAKIFNKKLKYLYKKIDSVSSLLWSHDNHITKGKRLRSENDKEDSQLKWKNKETAQTGYGEIAMVIFI